MLVRWGIMRGRISKARRVLRHRDDVVAGQICSLPLRVAKSRPPEIGPRKNSGDTTLCALFVRLVPSFARMVIGRRALGRHRVGDMANHRAGEGLHWHRTGAALALLPPATADLRLLWVVLCHLPSPIPYHLPNHLPRSSQINSVSHTANPHAVPASATPHPCSQRVLS
jgi:hypothetical protein